ncbi:MAG: autotransporter outer membrane beta-barrel domain-containing protein, partial [Hyphomicrobiales bacterium]|nr:autotransporter outer membrane beta-barrel domain-containing protein [Hyphomicrobiales bacterium]
TINGSGGAGYFVNGIGVNSVSSNISATNTVARTLGANSPGGLLTNGGTLTINGGSVTTIGAGSDGFLFMPVPSVPFTVQPGNPGVSPGDPTQPNTLTINNARVASAADAFHVTGVPANITVTGSTVTDNNGVLLSTQSSGATDMMVSGSQLSGAILTDMISNPLQSQGTLSTANVTLQGNTTWTMTGSSNLTTLTNNASNIIFTPPTGDPTQLSSYKTLTVMMNSADPGGNYTGVNGRMTLNTFLGADSSPSDRLVINGGTGTGTTALTIENTTGTGALTVANGILVVQAINGGATTPTVAANGAAAPGDAFSLANGEELRGGAFDYRLFRGGPVNSGDFSVPNSWFLRNVFVTPPIVIPPIVPPPVTPPPVIPPLVIPPPVELVPPPPTIPGEPPVTVLPPTPPPDPLPPNVEAPIIGPELATYGVVQPLARQLGLSILGTLNDRVGDTYEPDVYPVQPPVAPAELPTKKGALPTKKPGPALVPRPLFSPSVWGRFFGQTIDNRYSAFADPRARGNLGGFQGGIDLLRGPVIPGGFDRAGLYGAYGNVNSDVTGLITNPAATAYVLTHTGSMSLDAWSAGGYWTHVGPSGWYLDGVLQGTWYYGSASTQDARLNTDGTGFIASLEGGVPFALPQLGPGFVLEPQGQILWQKVSFRQDYDGLGNVALGDTTGPSGRMGLRGKWTIVTANDQVWQPYLRANLWRDWGADANTVYSGTNIVPLLSQITLLEVGGGVTGRINANVSVFANVDYEFAVGAANGQKQNGVRGAFGARYTW